MSPWLSITAFTVLLASAASAAELTPEIPYPGQKQFVWSVPGAGYRSYSLRLSAVPNGEVRATFILIEDGKLAGRFPLRTIDTNDSQFPIRFAVACLADRVTSQSWIQVSLVRTNGQAQEQVFEFRLTSAVDDNSLRKDAVPQPGGGGNSHQPTREVQSDR